MIGKCKLCLRDGVDLQQSHFLPAGIYRILRDDGVENPNPWVITQTTEFQTSAQMKARLLCPDCEQRLSKNGEQWVLSHCLQRDGTFPFATVLASRTPVASDSNSKVYHACDIPEINISAVAYFAMSIFWRGAIYPWNQDGGIPVKLGPFEESFRRYLIGDEDFPSHCSLFFTVREGKAFDRLTYAPIGERKDGVHVYKFPMPGFGFSIAVSKNLPAVFRRTCFVRGNGNPVTVTSLIEQSLEMDARKMRSKHIPKRW
jgi:hypothetical protein